MLRPQPLRPRGGVDYPRNLIEFEKFFPDDQACREYLEHLRWGDGFTCPDGHIAKTIWRSERGLVTP